MSFNFGLIPNSLNIVLCLFIFIFGQVRSDIFTSNPSSKLTEISQLSSVTHNLIRKDNIEETNSDRYDFTRPEIPPYLYETPDPIDMNVYELYNEISLITYYLASFFPDSRGLLLPYNKILDDLRQAKYDLPEIEFRRKLALSRIFSLAEESEPEVNFVNFKKGYRKLINLINGLGDFLLSNNGKSVVNEITGSSRNNYNWIIKPRTDDLNESNSNSIVSDGRNSNNGQDSQLQNPKHEEAVSTTSRDIKNSYALKTLPETLYQPQESDIPSFKPDEKKPSVENVNNGNRILNQSPKDENSQKQITSVLKFETEQEKKSSKVVLPSVLEDKKDLLKDSVAAGVVLEGLATLAPVVGSGVMFGASPGAPSINPGSILPKSPPSQGGVINRNNQYNISKKRKSKDIEREGEEPDHDELDDFLANSEEKTNSEEEKVEDKQTVIEAQSSLLNSGKQLVVTESSFQAMESRFQFNPYAYRPPIDYLKCYYVTEHELNITYTIIDELSIAEKSVDSKWPIIRTLQLANSMATAKWTDDITIANTYPGTLVLLKPRPHATYFWPLIATIQGKGGNSMCITYYNYKSKLADFYKITKDDIMIYLN